MRRVSQHKSVSNDLIDDQCYQPTYTGKLQNQISSMPPSRAHGVLSSTTPNHFSWVQQLPASSQMYSIHIPTVHFLSQLSRRHHLRMTVQLLHRVVLRIRPEECSVIATPQRGMPRGMAHLTLASDHLHKRSHHWVRVLQPSLARLVDARQQAPVRCMVRIRAWFLREFQRI